MKIKKIEITGFKSFVDRSVVLFNHDVTGIVGPNGCGKSNIVDAIRWVMGEQSAKNLRGRMMEDVIFNGSESRGPHGFAEVSLTFDNEDGLTPPEYRDYPEITVTRRLDRQGRSDYLINRTAVRLLDITNLFLGTGVGKRAYSIIEQGRIGFIVSSKPVDRRHIIDEAAGVTKFKARKRAAERKMEHTRGNLNRVTDIIQEIERTLASLKRQAQKAERYRRYRDELRGLELHVAAHRYLELQAQHRHVARALDTADAALEGQRLALRFREAESDAERAVLNELDAQVEQAHRESFEQENALQLIESQMDRARERIEAMSEADLRLCRDRDELEGQRRDVTDELSKAGARQVSAEQGELEAQGVLETAHNELEGKRQEMLTVESALLESRQELAERARAVATAEAEVAELERSSQRDRLRQAELRQEQDIADERITELDHTERELLARLEGLREGHAKTDSERDGVEAELKRLRAEIGESDQILEGLRDALAEKRSRLRSLGEIQERFEGVAGGARELMKAAEQRGAEVPSLGVLGLLADRLECAEEWTVPLAAALGDRLQDVVVESVEAGKAALGHLEGANLGRATVLPREGVRGGGAANMVPAVDGVMGCLADNVQSVAGDQQLVRRLLKDVLVVQSIDVALSLQAESAWQGSFVTPSGAVLRADGSLTGGTEDEAGTHLIAMKRELRELEEVVAGLSTQLGEAQERHGELRSAIASRQASLENTRTERHDAELAIVTAEKDLKRAREERDTTRATIARLQEAITALESQLAQSDAEAAAQQAIEVAREQERDVSSRIAAQEEQVARRREVVEAHNERVTEFRVEAAQATERAEAERLTVSRLANGVEDLDRRIARVVAEIRDGAQQQGQSLGELLRLADSRETGRARVAAATDTLSSLRDRHETTRDESQRLEAGLRLLRSALDEGSGELSKLTVGERELALEIEHLVAQTMERHRTRVEEHLLEHHAREPVDSEGVERIAELIRLIERMGEINLTAIDEFEEKSERHGYLTSQRADLEDALGQLERAIRQMNRESRRLFREAFAAVNERFQKVFPAMFGGGRAELQLTDSENLLESGVEIIAQPPGKRLGSLELMSGGEKALTAVSLIFAIFQYRPSPFCLLDEVDAPLDEANIGRFSEAVRSMTDRSQFILITHAKRTMEAADVLYGVTMEEPGVSKLVSVEMNDRSRVRAETSRVAVA